MIYAAILGHGTVGSGVAEILINHNALVSKKIKNDISVKYILELRDFSHLPYAEKFTNDFNKMSPKWEKRCYFKQRTRGAKRCRTFSYSGKKQR